MIPYLTFRWIRKPKRNQMKLLKIKEIICYLLKNHLSISDVSPYPNIKHE